MGLRQATFEEAVLGIPGVIASLPKGTSPGWPYSTEHRPGGKKYWFGAGDFDLTTPQSLEFRKNVEAEMSLAKTGVRPFNPFKDAVKVELRELHKAFEPRQICAHSMKGTVGVRMCCLSFIIAFFNARFEIGSALGMNVHGEEWQQLYALMMQFSGFWSEPRKAKDKIAGDYKGYDKDQLEQYTRGLAVLMDLYYLGEPEENRIARNLYLMDMWDSYHIVTVYSDLPPTTLELVGDCVVERTLGEGSTSVDVEHYGQVSGKRFSTTVVGGKTYYVFTVLYHVTGCMPSGFALTTVGNIYANNVILRVCAIQSYFDDFDVTFADSLVCSAIWDRMYIVAFGDDHMIHLHHSLLDKISFESIKKWVQYMGMDYTDALKTGEDYKHIDIEQCSFLKRTFEYCPEIGRHVALLPEESIDGMVCWRHEREHPSIMGDRVEEYFKEWAYAGEDKFNEKKEQLLPHLLPEHIPSSLSWRVHLQKSLCSVTEYF